MNREDAVFQIAYRAGIGHYEIGYDETLSESERQENLSSATVRFEEALESGGMPNEEDVFDCRTRLGNNIVDAARAEGSAKNGLL